MNNQTYVGSVKNFDEEKGWGHIICDATRALYGKDMFVLRSALHGQTITAGQQVRFKVGMGQKGPEAQQIIPVNRGGGQVIKPPAGGIVVPPTYGKGAKGQWGGKGGGGFHTPQQAMAC